MGTKTKNHEINSWYENEHLERVAFPLGGFGTGSLCIEGCGHLSQISLRHKPDFFRDARATFAAFAPKGSPESARVLEGPVPRWRAFGVPDAATGSMGSTIGLPRFQSARFLGRFPFCTIEMADPDLSYDASISAFSPFTPPDPDDSSLPAAILTYTIRNRSKTELEGDFSFNMLNLIRDDRGGNRGVRRIDNGLLFYQEGSDDCPQARGEMTMVIPEPAPKRDPAWFRGAWFDALTVAWKNASLGSIKESSEVDESAGGPSPGGSLSVPLQIGASESATVTVILTWYVPRTDICHIKEKDGPATGQRACCTADNSYVPWYAGRFKSAEEVARYVEEDLSRLKHESKLFAETLYSQDMPPEAIEAIGANLAILKTPTMLRQSDGRIWAYEGCCDSDGCCAGSCTHVWNYAQAIPHLFPSLERTLRETEFIESQDDSGHQSFRAALPIQEADHSFYAAADGQLGGIVKLYREWRISGDLSWLRKMWKPARESLEFCIAEWDPSEEGWIREPHHNTYDIEFWGPEPMCTTIYRAALLAAADMAAACGEPGERYTELANRAFDRLDDLYNGEYFEQRIESESPSGKQPIGAKAMMGEVYSSPEAVALLGNEGPKYQYGTGCLSDQLLGDFLAVFAGIDNVLDNDKARSALTAIHRYNLKSSFVRHANPQRATYAFGDEGGLVLCTWPRGGRLTLPMVYAEEVWTGIEYQVAANAIARGLVSEGLEIVRHVRGRYDGRYRNPYDEYECGHWYARALSSYALLAALSGARYDAVDKVLVLRPRIEGDFSCLLSTDSGYGNVGVRGGKPFLEVVRGEIEVSRIDYLPC